MIVDLLTALSLATGVIDFAAPSRSLGAMLVRHVRLCADDRLDAFFVTRPIKIQNSVHVAVVSHAQRGLPVFNGLIDQLRDSRGAVQHRELGVHVKM